MIRAAIVLLAIAFGLMAAGVVKSMTSHNWSGLPYVLAGGAILAVVNRYATYKSRA